MIRLAPLLLLVLSACAPAPAAPRADTVQVSGLEPIRDALAAREGHACLVNFWATWCPPCVAELPDLAAVARDYADRGGRVMGVSYDLMVQKGGPEAAREAVRAFLAEREIELPTWIIAPGAFEAVDAHFGLPDFVPVTLAFDRNGQEVDRHEGQASRARFAEMMEKALGP